MVFRAFGVPHFGHDAAFIVVGLGLTLFRTEVRLKAVTKEFFRFFGHTACFVHNA